MMWLAIWSEVDGTVYRFRGFLVVWVQGVRFLGDMPWKAGGMVAL